MRIAFLVPMALVVAACGSEPVVKAATCTDPCCDGNPGAINCAETPDVSCTAKAACGGAYGCTGGAFFSHPVPDCDAGGD